MKRSFTETRTFWWRCTAAYNGSRGRGGGRRCRIFWPCSMTVFRQVVVAVVVVVFFIIETLQVFKVQVFSFGKPSVLFAVMLCIVVSALCCCRLCYSSFWRGRFARQGLLPFGLVGLYALPRSGDVCIASLSQERTMLAYSSTEHCVITLVCSQ